MSPNSQASFHGSPRWAPCLLFHGLSLAEGRVCVCVVSVGVQLPHPLRGRWRGHSEFPPMCGEDRFSHSISIWHKNRRPQWIRSGKIHPVSHSSQSDATDKSHKQGMKAAVLPHCICLLPLEKNCLSGGSHERKRRVLPAGSDQRSI